MSKFYEILIFMNRNFLLILLACVAGVVSSCYRDPETQPELPMISIDKSALETFSYESGASQQVVLTANRNWTIECSANWLAFDYEQIQVTDGETVTVPVSITALSNNVGNIRSAVVRFKTSTVYADLYVEQNMNSEFAPSLIYYNGFGKDLGGDDNPLLKETTVWDVATGVAGEVHYYQSEAYISVRNSTTGNSIDNMTPCYAGASGDNHLFFGKTGPAFTVAEIAVHPKLTMLQISFGVFNIDNVALDKSKFLLSVSKDGQKWVPLDYKILSVYDEPKWNMCEAEFYFAQGSFEKLYVMLDAELESKFRMDDLTIGSDLSAEDADPAEYIDWTSGVEKALGSSVK